MMQDWFLKKNLLLLKLFFGLTWHFLGKKQFSPLPHALWWSVMYRLKTSELSHSPLGLGVPFKRVQIMVCSKTSAATGNCSKCSPVAGVSKSGQIPRINVIITCLSHVTSQAAGVDGPWDQLGMQTKGLRFLGIGRHRDVLGVEDHHVDHCGWRDGFLLYQAPHSRSKTLFYWKPVHKYNVKTTLRVLDEVFVDPALQA